MTPKKKTAKPGKRPSKKVAQPKAAKRALKRAVPAPANPAPVLEPQPLAQSRYRLPQPPWRLERPGFTQPAKKAG